MNLEALRQDSVLRNMIEEDEGLRSRPYKDTKGIWTAGIGHNLESHGDMGDLPTWLKKGVPDDTIKGWFNEDIDAATTCCAQIFSPEFELLPDDVQRVLVDMAFDLMYELWDWRILRAAIAEQNWAKAAQSIERSKFASQAPSRCRRLAQRMEKAA
ncbi:MAG: glycoside hydrolase family protein [Syntrophobacteraceae bacterium]